MIDGPVLVAGSAGFLGRHVVAALHRGGRRLRLMWRRTPPPLPQGAAVEWVHADLDDAASLARACENASAVVHAAAHIGDDEARCQAVNARGTGVLVAAARRAGVARFLYLSTTAVYGWAVHSGATEDEVTVAPATPVSRSRAAGEEAVLAVGGIVLRPTFVYGDGDTRFVPAIVAAMRRVPFFIRGGRARLSVIAADDLGRLTAALATRAAAGGPASYHANDRQPIAFADIAVTLASTLGVRLPSLSLPYALARRIARVALPGQRSPSAAHRIFLVACDHYYDSSQAWRVAGLDPGPRFQERFAAFLPWYRRFGVREEEATA